MQNLFIQDQDEFTVKFAVAMAKDGSIVCDLTKESVEDMLTQFVNFEGAKVETYEAVFKKPSFGDTMSLYDSIFSVSDQAGVNFNPVTARFRKISALIKHWNLKGKEEKPTDDEIRQLHPVIANAIGIQVDAETGGLLS